VRTDDGTGQTIIAAWVNSTPRRARRPHDPRPDVVANVEAQVAYRETITVPVEKIEERRIRQTGGRGEYGHVMIRSSHGPRWGFLEFVDKVAAIPPSTSAVGAGCRKRSGGVLAATLVDIRAILTTALPTSTRARWRSRSPGRWRSRRRPAGEASTARADHGGGGRHPRGLHG
jgi:elongation factor G